MLVEQRCEDKIGQPEVRAAEQSELAHCEAEEGEQRRETVRCSDETSEAISLILMILSSIGSSERESVSVQQRPRFGTNSVSENAQSANEAE